MSTPGSFARIRVNPDLSLYIRIIMRKWVDTRTMCFWAAGWTCPQCPPLRAKPVDDDAEVGHRAVECAGGVALAPFSATTLAPPVPVCARSYQFLYQSMLTGRFGAHDERPRSGCRRAHPRGVDNRELPVSGSGKERGIVTTTGQNRAPISSRSQTRPQGPENRPKTDPETPISTSATFAASHRRSESVRCPSCSVKSGDHCIPLDSATIRRRGRRWHHDRRYQVALAGDPARTTERASLAAAISAAPTAKRPKPGPPPRRLAPAPVGNVEAALRTALGGLQRDAPPAAVQAALAAAGLRLGLDTVSEWLDGLNERRTR